MKQKKKTNAIGANFLEFVPERSKQLRWSAAEDGLITLDIENTGILNRLCQRFLHKPKYTHIHLDRVGSFVWPLIDGKKNIIELGKTVRQEFGQEAEPLYERLAKYFQVLESYHFIQLKKENP